MPQVALVICTIFVLFMLRLEHRQAPEVSLAVWIPTLWFLLVSSKPLGAWFGSGGPDAESGSPLDQIFLIVILLSGLITLKIRNFGWESAIRGNIWVVTLLVYMCAGSLLADMPMVSLKRVIREAIPVVMAFFILSEPDPKQALQSVFRRAIYILIPFSYVLIHYYPMIGRVYGRWSGALQWVGVTSQKNGLGRLCLFSAFFLLWTFIIKRQGEKFQVVKYQAHFEVVILLLTLWLMGGPQHNFSYSVTSNVCLIVGLSCIVGLGWMRKRGFLPGQKVLVILTAFIIFYGTMTPFLGKLTFFDVSSTFGRSEDLTERGLIWQELIPYAMERPLAGHGIGGFLTRPGRVFDGDLFQISQAHSGYLSIILNFGFLGLLLFSMYFLSFVRNAQIVLCQDSSWGGFLIGFLLMALVHNISESTVVGFANAMSAILVLLAIASSRPTNTWDSGYIEN
jgi:exopolysaccharide production protein ExoQ